MGAFTGTLAKQAWMIAPETVTLMAALSADGGEARFVGGCVRNALCNRKVIDIDIATPLKPDEVIERLTAAKIHYVPTGLKHGTVTAIVDGKPFEITTLRVDVQNHGRHADVAFTADWKADAARRDFTINAMSATPDGDLYDPFNGVDDLRKGRVIFVGDAEKRIAEDILRILRYFRFLAHFGKGEADKGAIAACAKFAPQIKTLSAERLRQETLKLLESDRAGLAWRLMMDHDISAQYLPEAERTDRLDALIALETKHHTQAFPLRRLAALLDIDRTGLKRVTAALRLSNAQAAQLEKMIAPAASHIDAPPAVIRALVYREGNDMARNLLLLDAARAGVEKDFAALYQTATAFRAPRLPIEGDDALKLGARGPEVGRILKAVEAWWILQDFQPARTACLEQLRKEHAHGAV